MSSQGSTSAQQSSSARSLRSLSIALASSIGGALIGFAVVPVYIRTLGVEVYGLIGFFTALQAMFQVLDFGLGPTLNRELARAHLLTELEKSRVLMHTLASISWSVAAGIALVIVTLSGPISRAWLKSSGSLSPESTQIAVALIGVVIACRWPIALYQSALIGKQRLGTSSGLTLTMSALASGGAICVLRYVHASIEAFFIWQALVGLCHSVAIRTLAWRAVGPPQDARIDLGMVKPLLHFSAGILMLTVTGLLFSQLDKLVLSRLLPLDRFGAYALASVAASALNLLVAPVYSLLYPKFAALHARGDQKAIRHLYRSSSQLLASVLFPTAAVLIVFGRPLILLWTGNADLTSIVTPLVAVLAAGSALHGLMYIPYALQLASGTLRVPLMVNLTLLVVVVPLIVVLTTHYGVMGGAFAWLVFHSLYVVLGTTLTHRYTLKDMSAWHWLLVDVGLPLLCSLLVALCAYRLNLAQTGHWSVVVLAVLCGLTAMAVSMVAVLVTNRDLAAEVSSYWSRITIRVSPRSPS